jgi:hypothetical protein
VEEARGQANRVRTARRTATVGSATVTVGHDLHLSHTRLVVDGATIAARVRLFEDDLIKALTAAAKSPTAVPVTDAAVAAYLGAHIGVRADGALLSPTIAASGEESDAQNQRVRWYLLTYQAARPVQQLGVRVATFLELYGDQQNVVVAAKGATGPRRSLVFTAEAAREQVIAM